MTPYFYLTWICCNAERPHQVKVRVMNSVIYLYLVYLLTTPLSLKYDKDKMDSVNCAVRQEFAICHITI